MLIASAFAGLCAKRFPTWSASLRRGVPALALAASLAIAPLAYGVDRMGRLSHRVLSDLRLQGSGAANARN